MSHRWRSGCYQSDLLALVPFGAPVGKGWGPGSMADRRTRGARSIFTACVTIFLTLRGLLGSVSSTTAASLNYTSTDSSTPHPHEVQAVDEEEDPFLSRLVREAELITAQHSIPTEILPELLPPQLHLTEGFMHEYITNTGSGNREVTVISEVSDLYNAELRLDNVLSWDSIRFNHTDYVLATTTLGCVLWSLAEYSDGLLVVRGVPTNVIVTEGIVQRCEMETINTKGAESLVFTLSTRDWQGLNVDVYEVAKDAVTHVFRKSSPGAVMTSYVDSGDRRYFVSVFDEQLSFAVITPNKFHSPHLEVNYPEPIAKASFVADGSGFLFLANITTCLIIQLTEEQPEIFDRLYQENIVSLTTFEYHSSVYLLVTSRDVQQLFLWHLDGLIFVQKLSISAVTSSYTAHQHHCLDTIFLVMVSDTLPLRIILWNGHKFDEGNAVILPSFRPDPASLSFIARGDVLVILAVENGISKFLAVRSTTTSAQDPVLDLVIKVTEEMNGLEAKLREEEHRGRALWNVLSHAVISEQAEPLIFEARQTLSGLKVTEGVEADLLLSELKHLEWEGSPLTSADLQWSVEELSGMIENLENTLGKLEEQMKDVVLLNEPAFVSGRKTILGSVIAPSAIADTLTIVEAGQRNVDLALQHLFRVNEDLVITGKKILKASLHVTDNADIRRVNEISLSEDVLLTSQPQQITGHWIFESPLMVDGDIEMDGKLNGFKVSEDFISLTRRNVIHDVKTFSGTLQVKGSVSSSLLDGVDMNKLFLNSITRTHSQVLHVLPPVLIEVMASQITELTVNGLVNGLDISRLGRNVARVNRPAEFTGRKTLVNPNLQGGIVVLGTYDGVYLPFDLFEPWREQEITGLKHFEHVRVKSAVVNGLVDGLNLEKDVVTLSGDEDAIQAYFAGGVTLEGNFQVGGFIDGVTVEQIEAIVTEPKNGSTVDVVMLKPVVVETTLIIKDVVGIDFDAIARDLVYPDDKEIVFTGLKVFTEVEAYRIALNGKVNGFDIRRDFVTTGTSQFVNGTKRFTRPVVFGSHVEIGTGIVDGVDLFKLANDYISLASASRPFIGGVTSTNQLSVRGDLRVLGTVNGMDLKKELVVNNEPAYNLANKAFAGGLTVAGQLDIVQGELMVAHLDGVNWDNFLRRRVTLDTDQTLEGSMKISGSRTTSLDVPQVNGVNLQQFASDVMTLSTAQLVTGKKSFTGPAFAHGAVKSLDGVNGFDIQGLASRAIRLDAPLIVDHKMTFDKDLHINGDLTVNGRINGVDMNRLASMALRKSSFLPMTGNNTFLSGLDVRGDIVAREVNGRQLSKDLLLNHGDQEITGVYTFSAVSTRDMTLKGLLNDLDIVKLNEETAKTNIPAVFRSDMTVAGDLSVLEGTKVLGLVNGISLDDLAKEAVYKNTAGEPQVVMGMKIFMSPVVIEGNADFGMVHEVPLTEFLHDVVYIDQDLEIGSEKTFETFVIMGDLRAKGKVNVRGQVDGVNLEWIVENALFIDQPDVISGDVYIVDNSAIGVLATTGLVNNINITIQPLLLYSEHPQMVTGTKNFSIVRLEASMDVSGTVNGYVLPDLLKDTLLINHDQTVLGTKTFKGQTTVVRPHYGVVNQVDLSRDAYLLTEDIEFQDNVIFDHDIVFQKELSLKGLINDLDLTVLSEEALSTTGEQEILAPYVIHEVSSPNVLVEGHVSGIDMDKFLNEVKDFHSGTGQELDNLRIQTEQRSSIVDDLVRVTSEAVSVLDGLVLEQQLNVSGWALDVSPDQVVFVDSMNKLHHQVWTWKDGKLIFHQIQQLDISDGTSLYTNFGSLAGKYGLAELPSKSVWAKVIEDAVVFTRRSADGMVTSDVTLPFLGAMGVRLFSSGDTVYALVATGPNNFCDPVMVHLLKWPSYNPEPVKIQDFIGGDLDFGVFEVDGLQYIFLAGKDDGPFGNTVKVYHRKCACADGPFSLLSRMSTSNIVSVELFSLDYMVYMVWANRTNVQITQFAGFQGLTNLFSVRTTHVLNVRVNLVQGQLYLLVGQAKGLASNLLLKSLWNGPTRVHHDFTRWL